MPLSSGATPENGRETGFGVKGGEDLTEQQINEFRLALLEFVKRAAEKGATAEAVEALPAVARVLLEAIRDLP